MDVYLIDGTYELFRHFFAVPAAADVGGQEVGAVRGVLASVLSMIEHGATHIGVATDHVVESFRNDLYPGYKTSEGVLPELLSQFPILEEALEAMGVLVWAMVYLRLMMHSQLLPTKQRGISASGRCLFVRRTKT
jgi:5'-3' exonuclease